jgi:hypothetical protein
MHQVNIKIKQKIVIVIKIIITSIVITRQTK